MTFLWAMLTAQGHPRQVEPSGIPAPRDEPFEGVIRLDVDARDVRRKLFHVRETLPVQTPGRMTLLYPQWEASSHAPSISVASLAGLVVSAGAQRLEWQRDALEMHAFHVEVPEGVSEITVEFQYVVRPGEALLRPGLVAVQWQRLLLYPAGWYARRLPVQPSVRLPSGLHPVSSLTVESASEDTLRFGTIALDTLLDAPVLAARYHRAYPLALPGQPLFRLSLMSEEEDIPALPQAEVAAIRRMLAQTRAVFGRAPYAKFEAMLVLGDTFPPGGVEHAGGAEIYLPANYFRDHASQLNNLDLIVHEHVHAWNGRFRVPEGQWTPIPNTPMRNAMLWAYEGQTEFWGRVLAARSGLRTRQDTLDKLALDAAEVQLMTGRAWKTLRDTTNDPLYLTNRSAVWPEWQRRKDYYTEGVLLWLDVDMTLREGTAGRHGLDDVATAFYSVDRTPDPRPYTFDDLCAALYQRLPIDWSAYLHARLDAHQPRVLDALERAGWALVYDDQPTATFVQHEAELGGDDLRHAIGLVVDAGGQVQSVLWDSAAYREGVAAGMMLEAVNGAPFSRDALRGAVAASRATPVSLRVRDGADRFEVTLDYRGGLRYPHLRRLPGHADRLTPLLAPRSR